MPEPVVFVPGYPGSHLTDAEGRRIFVTAGTLLSGASEPLLEGPDDLSPAGDDGVRADEPIRAALELGIVDLQRQAATLYDLLDRLGVSDVVRFGWDWRRPVWDHACPFSLQNRLQQEIENLHATTGRKVTLLVHSTGGLVARSLIEDRADAVLPHLARVISLGVPWAGVMRTIHFLAGGNSFLGVVPAGRAQEIMARSWAAWDLIPPDPAHLGDANMVFREAGGVRAPVDLLAERGWIAGLPAALRPAAGARAMAVQARQAGRRPQIDTGGRALEVVNVVGWGFPTQCEATVTGAGAAMRFTTHEVETGDAAMDGGDGTAPRRSAAWVAGGNGVSVRTYHLPIGVLSNSRSRIHASLWMNPGGQNLLAHHLVGQPLEPWTYVALGREALESHGPAKVTVRAVALDAGGAPLPNARLSLLDLTPGGPIEHDFNPAFAGRALFKLDRARIRRRAGNPKVRTMTARFSWDDPAGNRVTGERQTFSFLESP